MQLTRRKIIKSLAQLSTASLICQLLPAFGASKEPLYGINAYYLMVESYRKVRENPRSNVRKVIRKYLHEDLQLVKIREKSKINAVRFWAFNNYPVGDKTVANVSFDAALWPTVDRLDNQVLEVLDILLQSLAETGFYIVPVLSNYWVEYGGILRYLEWAGRIKSADWFDAYCRQKDEELYQKYAIDFYNIPQIEKYFQTHITPVVALLRKTPNVVIVDIMNEPRGKSRYSESNQVVQNGLYSHQIVAQWLNRQANFIRKDLPSQIMISSGEEGWLMSPVDLSLKYLKNESQYYEGIDLKSNLDVKNSALNMGSIHMYTHGAVELPKVNSCGHRYSERRGWDFLLQPNQPQRLESYVDMGDEWLSSRAAAIANSPWYIGEMGWCRSQSPENLLPLNAAKLQQERIKIYRHWTEKAFGLGARGVFLWGLNGLEHKDEFYGLSSNQVMEIFPK